MYTKITNTIFTGIIITLFLLCPAYTQTGYPYISHFSFNEDIDFDNFDITQDDYHNLLIANRKGIITFDSRNWHLIPVAGFPTVIENDTLTDHVFVGTRQGFGYAARNNSGNYEYHSIIDNDSAFETDQIFILKDKVYFIGKQEIRLVPGNQPDTVTNWKFEEDNSLQGTFSYKNDLFFISEKSGLMKTSGDTFEIVRSDSYIKKFIVLYSTTRDSVNTIITSPDNKVYKFDGRGFKEILLEGSRYLQECFITGVSYLQDDNIAFSTLMGGCLIASIKTGKTMYIINSRTGLPDDELFAMTKDRNDGLWLCHTKGLSRIDMKLPVTGFSHYEGIEGDLLSAIWFDNTLYVGTTEGLFRLTEKRIYREKVITVRTPPPPPPPPVEPAVTEEEKPATLSDIRALRRAQRKERASGEKSQTGSGIIGGLFQKIFVAPDGKTQKEAEPTTPSRIIRRRVTDEVKKTRIYDLQSISHTYNKVDQIRGKCKDLVIAGGRLLASTNNGLFEIKENKAVTILPDQYITFLETGEDGKTIYAGTDEGAVTLCPYASGWKILADYRNIGCSVYSVARTPDSTWYLGSDNSVWMIRTNSDVNTSLAKQYTLDLEYSEQVKIKIINDTITLFLSSSIWQLQDSLLTKIKSFPGIYSLPRYFLNNKTVWIRSGYRWEQPGSNRQQDYTSFLSIFNNVRYISLHEDNSLWIINDDKDVYHITGQIPDTTMVFDAYIASVSGDNKYFPLIFPEIDHKNRSLKITFSAPWYISPAKTEFRYYIEGLNKSWSEWSNSSTVEYPVLPPGDYRLFVQARNSFGNNSKEITLDFTIKPPYWQTTWFRMLVIIAITGLFFMIMQIRQRSLIRAKRILEEKVKERTREIERQKNEIAEQKQEITDSIHYARQIQKAVLPCEKSIIKNISECFILFLPRDIVSGDFYWHRTIQDKTIIVAADCTGHGVPGAFMSMLGVSFLNEIVSADKITNASQILNSLRVHVNETLSISGEQEHARDGMDIALCIIDRKKAVLDYAGAYNSLYHIRNNELTEIKADKMPIGYYEKADQFTNHQIKIKPGDVFYIFSDGFIDQFGGTEGKKYLSRNFKNLLLNHHHLPMTEQKAALYEEHQNWRGIHYQIDDILVIGFRI